MQFDTRADVWRMSNTSGGYETGKTLRLALAQIPAKRVPLSKFDILQRPLAAAMTPNRGEQFRTGGSETTDIFLLPYLFADRVRYDDELRWGRYINNMGTAVAHRYVVRGIQDYGPGHWDAIEVYVKELR